MGAAPSSSDDRGDTAELSVVTELERLVFSTTGTSTLVGTFSVAEATAAAEVATTVCEVGARVRN